jgi:hypothetical protein
MRSRIAKGGIAGLGGVLGPVREQNSLKSESESLDTVAFNFHDNDTDFVRPSVTAIHGVICE